MYKTKKDIDAHVESLISKLPLKEFTSRGYSIGRLYYEVEDYNNCCRYVEQYLAVNSSNAAAHTLLGQALQKLGKLKRALEEFITSYELCPTQNSLVLNKIGAQYVELNDTPAAIAATAAPAQLHINAAAVADAPLHINAAAVTDAPALLHINAAAVAEAPAPLHINAAAVADAPALLQIDAAADADGDTDNIVPAVPELDPELLQALGDPSDDTPVNGLDIHDKLAQRWLPILKKGMPKEAKEQLLKDYTIPGNCKLLKAPTLNAEISAAIADIVRSRDKKIQAKQDQLGLGITAINRAMDVLLSSDDKVQVIKILSDSCRILSDLHFVETEVRSKLITPGLDKSFLSVIQDQDRDETLFGVKISEKIKASKVIEKQGLQIKKNFILKAQASTSFAPPPTPRPRQQGNWSAPPRFTSSSRGGTPGPTEHRRRTSTRIAVRRQLRSQRRGVRRRRRPTTDVQKRGSNSVCEILADIEENIDPARAKYWCEKAEKKFPKHPVTFQLREKLLSISNPNPQALDLLKEELAVRPKDVLVHIRLLKFYLKNNNVEEAFTHSYNIEFRENYFLNNFEWYETIAQILKCNPRSNNDWLFQLLLLTVTERMCVLSLTRALGKEDKSIFESTELLHTYDQAIERVAKAGFNDGHGEFHACLLKHHRNQFAFNAATLLLKRGANYLLRDSTRDAEPLMLMAWHCSVADPSASWVISAPETQQKAVRRWYSEGSYRCSQSGHYLLSNLNNTSQSFLDRVSQNCSGTHWRDKLYGKIFTGRYHLEKINNSHLVSTSFDAPALMLPKRGEVETYDEEAQRAYGNSLHHSVWLLLQYKTFSQFKCTTFDMLPLGVQNDANCGPESLCQLDVYAFLYCATLTCRQLQLKYEKVIPSEMPKILPANITELLCSLSHMKWWDCAYKFSQNELGTEMTDIRATLSRGIEVVRCIDNHGLDAELLCELGRIFSNRAKHITDIEDKKKWELRAVLYFTSAIKLMKNKKNDTITKSDQHLFDKPLSLSPKDTKALLEECKLYVALYELNNDEFEKAIELLTPLKSAQALYHLSVTYKKMALNENKYPQNHTNDESNSKYVSLLSTAQKYAYEAHYKLKDLDNKSDHMLLMETEGLINELDFHLNELSTTTDNHVKNSSDEYFSIHANEDIPFKHQSLFSQNFSSTPKRLPHLSMGPSSIPNVSDQQFISLSKFDKQKSMLTKDTTMNDFIELAKNVFEDNRILGNQIMTMINSNTLNTTEQFALLKISVDHVKNQIDECRKECKDVGELKKQIVELKKDICKIKKASEQTINENELFNLDEGYTANDTTSTFVPQLPFTAQQVMPPFNQRLIPPFTVPPSPFQLYGQNLFNLYSQFSQPSSVPGAPSIFDAARPQVNYPGVFSTPDQMYLDVANLVQQTIPTAPSVPVGHVPASVSTSVVAPTLPAPHSTTPITTTTKTQNVKAKDIPRSLPTNVVITSSGPLPTCTTTPASVLSVTVPPKHIKGIPHNYQIQMPVNEPTPTFAFPSPENKISSSAVSSNWTQNAVFKEAPSPNPNSAEVSISFSPKFSNISINEEVSAGIANVCHNKSRTMSEKSNTSLDNYDPCPDFRPIIPLPAEVKVTTGEEDEIAIFSARAKLYRFVDNQWKERGLGEIKLLKHKITRKVRVLMRREQIHKICANHAITSYMEIKPMKNETKAYIWVANDFADETLVLEKFCVRFKTADVARQFYETFEKARSEATVTSADSEVPLNLSSTKSDKPGKTSEITKTLDIKSTSGGNLPPTKTVFGGFTFSSTPAFKAVDETKPSGNNVESTPTTKVNVFSGLNFKTGPACSPFNDLFNTSNSQTNSSKVPEQNIHSSNKLNASDTVEEYEPTGEFIPVVPLPALVDTKTGEEGEIVLFEHRAKLLRFVAKEWKERGLGNIKLLVNKENVQKLRLLMRREQVMKVCCNHAVTKTMTFQKMPNVDKAVTWCAQDFSEGELTPETFCLRFKTVQACNDFIDAVKSAQTKLKDDTKAAKEELNAAKQNTQSGATTVNKPANSNWGDKFKPKLGFWECKECWVRNEDNVEVCPACNSPKNPGSANSNWGDKFKPKQGSWECKECLVRNEANVQICPACNSPKNPASANSIWGDKFKPKQGSWECKECLVRNEANVEICPACNSPKNPGSAAPNVRTTEAKVKAPNEIKFKFGISQQSIPVQTREQVTNAPIKSSWGDMFKPSVGSWECKACFVRNESGVDICCSCNSPKDPSAVNKTVTANTMWSTPKFKFGIPASLNTNEQKTETTSIFDGTGAHKFNFGIPSNIQVKSTEILTMNEKTSSASSASILLTGKTSDVIPRPTTLTKENKPALLSTPQKPNEAATFDFVFKPKTQQKAKSPVKSPKNDNGDESDGNEYASEDEGHHIHVTPIVPLPDKVKIVTGEEDEDELFGHRAKLLIFVPGEWKERGLGIVKILKHKHTSKLRVVMRREQVFKICLNHALTPDITYNLKDDKNWIFAANDFSEGELTVQRFCLKFKTKEIAMQFKNAVDKARGEGSNQSQNIAGNVDSDNEDVEFITETQSNAEEKKKALELMLPENFFLYKNKEACSGCRGCEDNKDVKPVTSKSTPSAFTAPTSLPSPQNITSNNVTQDKINQGTKSIEEILQRPKLVSVNSSSSIFRAPMLSSSTLPGPQSTATSGSLQSDPKSIFASANSNLSSNTSMFLTKPSNNGNSEVKSIFGTVLNSNLNDKQKPDAKSVFGFSKPFDVFNQKESTLFSNTNKSLNFNQTSISTLSNVPPAFGNGKSIWTFDPKTDTKPPAENNSELVKLLNTNKENSTNISPKILVTDNLSTFSAIKSQPELKFQRNPEFKWEGAGQQLFAQTSKPKNTSDGDIEAETGNGAEEEYDPHYEPIVPLPDKITVTTGEEDEEKLFGRRCKLFRYNDTSREWKERGVGELKILHHPEKKTYRLLFRREQVHKAVLNMLLFTELELLPMSKSDRAWTWAGRNYAENPAGDQETLAVRFKTLEMATEFLEKVQECVRKLQAAAAQAVREEKEAEEKPKSFALLRLPKYLQDSARADNELAMKTDEHSPEPNTFESKGPLKTASAEREVPKRVLFQEAEQQQEASDEDAENYEHEQVYYQVDDYDTYYNEEEESGAYFSCDCEAEVAQGSSETACAQAHVQLLFDHTMYAPKIQLTNVATGELLADMLVHDETEFELSDATCSWTGTDYTSNDPQETTVTVTFPDSETAMQFYESCESSKEHNSAADGDTEE